MHQFNCTSRLIAVAMLLLLLVTPLITGCAQGRTAGGARYEMTANRDIRTTFGSSLQNVYDATLVAMESLSFPVDNSSVDKFEGIIEGETATDQRVTIELTRISDNSTQVDVRIGVLNDEVKAEALLSEIESGLENESTRQDK